MKEYFCEFSKRHQVPKIDNKSYQGQFEFNYNLPALVNENLELLKHGAVHLLRKTKYIELHTKLP